MTKSTRWALAIVGVVIIVVAAVAIGTGKDEQQATPVHEQEHSATEGSGATHKSGATGEGGGATGATGSDNSGGAAPGSEGQDDQSGGAAPQQESGGARADVVSPLLTPEKPRTIKVKKGQMVLIRARSGKAATLHVHGYEEMTELAPGKLGTLKFKATMDGEYEIEFHFDGSQTSAGILRVSP